jgi:hypothetical protein
MTQVVLGKDGKLTPLPKDAGKSGHKEGSSPCAFAGVAGTTILPEFPAAWLEFAPPTAEILPVRFATAVGRGLAAPPPLSTGPPVLI